jgi:uncharacterized protein (DUF4415 family)
MKKRISKKPSETDWVRLRAMRDEEIDFSDLPEQGEDFFNDATLRLPQPKETVCISLDRDVLEWFKAQGKSYQSRINSVLKAYKEAQGNS